MLINESLANLLVATEFGSITFDAEGKNNELKPEEQQKLGALRGFRYEEDQKPAPKAKEEPKGEFKIEEKKPAGKNKAKADKE